VTYNNEIKYNELWNMMPYNTSRGSSSRLFFSPEEGVSSLLRSVPNSPLKYTASHTEHCNLHRRYSESVKSRNSDMDIIIIIIIRCG
jgi:hypothetical protein